MTILRFKGYRFPYNPSTLTIQRSRNLLAYSFPYGTDFVQDIGKAPAVVVGKGSFFGTGAFQQYERLVEIYEEDGAGSLVLPSGQVLTAHFTGLGLTGRAGNSILEYSFTFTEQVEPGGGLVLK